MQESQDDSGTVSETDSIEYDFDCVGIIYELEIVRSSSEDLGVRLMGSGPVGPDYEDESFVSVLFGALANGLMFRPYIILRQKEYPKKEIFPVNFWNQNCDENKIVLDWMYKIWIVRHAGLKPNNPSFLIWNLLDSVHPGVKDVFKEFDTEIVSEPEGLMAEYSVLFDILVKEPYKNYLDASFTVKICRDLIRTKEMSLDDVTRIVWSCWDKITEESVASGFRSYKLGTFFSEPMECEATSTTSMDKQTQTTNTEPNRKLESDVAIENLNVVLRNFKWTL